MFLSDLYALREKLRYILRDIPVNAPFKTELEDLMSDITELILSVKKEERHGQSNTAQEGLLEGLEEEGK